MAWLTGWSYRKKIDLTGQSGAGTNYQIKLLIGETSGASGEQFDLEGNSLDFPTTTDSGDLRFTASNGVTELDFWIENVEGSTPNRLITVWVEVAANLDSNQSIYCYYGNASATNVSNGKNTFVQFDDFNDNSLDTAMWESGGTGTTTETGGALVVNTSVNTGNRYARIKTQYGLGYAVRCKSKVDGGDGKVWINFGGRIWAAAGTGNYFVESTTNQYATTLGSGADTNYHIFDYERVSSSLTRFSRDNGVATTQLTSDVYTGNQYIQLGPNGRVGASTMDWILLRKVIETEPTFSVAGSQETPGAGDFFFFL